MSGFGKKAFFAGTMLLAVGLLSTSTSYAAKTIKIGVLSPLTGLYSIVGKRTSQGINMAVKEINDAGGVLGHKFEALIRDSETNPASSVRTARRLILRDKVFALLGPLHGGAAIAVLLVEQNTRFACRLSDRVYIIDNGRVRFGGTVAQLEEDEELKSRYLAV